jgi:SAM-dependent methyltransferase
MRVVPGAPNVTRQTAPSPAPYQLAAGGQARQGWDHDRELIQLRTLWEEQQAHLAEYPGGRGQLHYLTKHLAFEPTIRRHLRAVDRITPYVRGQVLEWGCRHGPDAAILTMRLGPLPDLHGADRYPPGLFQPFHDFSGLVYRQLTDPVALPYPDEHFDTIIANGVLEHVDDPEASLDELHRVARPGGVLLIDALPNRYSYTEAWLRRTGGPAHARRYSSPQIAPALAGHGFDVIELRKVEVLPAMLNRVAPPVRRIFADASRAIDRINRVLERTPLKEFATNLFIVSHRLPVANPPTGQPRCDRTETASA